MPIIMSKLASKLDGSVKARVLTFLGKLADDDTSPGLHIEPISGSADRRVRTGRVDKFYRAVLFRIDGASEVSYVFHGVWPHDDAITVARRVILKVNPVNGLPQVEDTPVPRALTRERARTAPQRSRPSRRASAASLLVDLGVTGADLTNRLGLPADVVNAALEARNPDEILDLAARYEGWIGMMLVDLAGGTSVDDLVAQLELAPAIREGSDDDSVLKALTQPAARGEFVFIDDQQELRRVIEAGDFGAWRVFLHPEQRRYVDVATKGPFRLSGGAGTGKTVVLAHRARRLILENPRARVVLTTYTRNLSDALKDTVRQLDPTLDLAAGLGHPGLHAAGVDALVADVLRMAGHHVSGAVEAVMGETRANIGKRHADNLWREVLEDSTAELPPAVANETFLAAEYADVILPQRITTLDDYLRVRRPGRGLALSRQLRTGLWGLVEAYRARSRIDGTLSYSEAAAIAAECLAPDRCGAIADHVLVDEGQDLCPSRWQFLRALASPGPNDMFIAEDSHQRIYGGRFPLSRYGIDIVGRSRRLTLNYRTTAQNLQYALALLADGEYLDLEEQPEQHAYRSARLGPKPQICVEPEASRRLDHAATLLKDWMSDTNKPETIAVLVRDKFQRERFVAAMAERGVEVRAVDSERPAAGKPLVMTMHRAKGMEFSRVMLHGLDVMSSAERDRLAALDAADQADLSLRRRSLEYVAATRARDELAVLRASRGCA
ncbi:DNA helicase [Kineosporia sp. NBRC 101677]|uniref:UvrD-helicase domain-containing protein n=1 Tax=Kineosporia sp. NBRC 101677 TaxID=3032197 RepID=UPI0024A1AFDE|nr:UvrD-helicase domain-containing protein [Kineosporia sp. NBRC 101677]GLY17987.1 DNA helicase [Kineosporia sp. NBRC 101677]